MYKCTECGAEYEKKPQYCDCGNDEFVLTIEEKEETKPQEPEKPQKEVIIEPKSAKQSIPAYSEPQYIRPKLNCDPVSLVIFFVCLILSFIIVFVWNPVSETAPAEKKTEVVTQNIPPINSFWKDTPKPENESNENIIKKEVEQIVKKTETAVKNVQKTVSKPQTKPAATKTTQTKPAAKTTTQAAKTTTAKPQQTTAKPQQTTPAKQQEPQLTQQEMLKQIEDNAQKLLKSQQFKQEFATYKVNLRNEIGRKIDFTKVIGDGECVISFKLSSTGKLINRSFEQESSNITLNDAVYKAVMKTPSYNPPPEGYNSEILRLKTSFNNGNFSISLK